VAPRKTIVAITGGEPLVREDLEECGRELYKREFPWGFVTNGFALHRDRYARLLDAGLRSITISLDGLESSHDWFRGGKGSYNKAVKAIEMVAKTDNLMYDIVTCAHQRNFSELTRIKRLLIDLGVKRWRVFTVFPKGRAAENPDVALPDDQFLSLFEFIEATRDEGKILANYGCEGFFGAMEGRVRNNLFACMAGIFIGSVLVDGSISACPSLRSDYIQGNIYRDDFWDVWENRFRVMRNRSWTKQGACASCKVYRWCRGSGLHLRDEKTGRLLLCHYNRLLDAQRARMKAIAG
jgi:radical SAM enzyme (rSAM/lipoprotein system)